MILIALTAAAVMASVAAVVLIAVVASVRGEDRHGQLPHHAPTRMARGVRRLTGLRVCQPSQTVLNQPPFKPKVSSRVHRTRPANSPAQLIDEPSRAQTGDRSSA